MHSTQYADDHALGVPDEAHTGILLSRDPRLAGAHLQGKSDPPPPPKQRIEKKGNSEG